jgi:hypothetical protein
MRKSRSTTGERTRVFPLRWWAGAKPLGCTRRTVMGCTTHRGTSRSGPVPPSDRTTGTSRTQTIGATTRIWPSGAACGADRGTAPPAPRFTCRTETRFNRRAGATTWGSEWSCISNPDHTITAAQSKSCTASGLVRWCAGVEMAPIDTQHVRLACFFAGRRHRSARPQEIHSSAVALRIRDEIVDARAFAPPISGEPLLSLTNIWSSSLRSSVRTAAVAAASSVRSRTVFSGLLYADRRARSGRGVHYRRPVIDHCHCRPTNDARTSCFVTAIALGEGNMTLIACHGADASALTCDAYTGPPDRYAGARASCTRRNVIEDARNRLWPTWRLKLLYHCHGVSKVRNMKSCVSRYMLG